MSDSITTVIADAIGDANVLRDLVACACYDLVAGGWVRHDPADPRPMIDDLRLDLLAEHGPEIDYERRHRFSALVSGAISGGYLRHESKVVARVHTIVSTISESRRDQLAFAILYHAIETAHLLGARSPLLETMSRTFDDAQPKMRVNG